MDTLRNVFTKNNINGYESLKKYLDSSASKIVKYNVDDYITPKLVTVNENSIGNEKKILTNYDSSEHRMFGEIIELKFKYIDNELVFRNSKELLFMDCVFMDDIYVGDNIEKITIVNCIFAKKLSFTAVSMTPEVSISGSNMSILSIHNTSLSFQLSHSRINSFEVQYSKISSELFYSNRIEYISFGSDSQYTGVEIDVSQINISNLEDTRRFKNRTAQVNKDFVFQYFIRASNKEQENEELLDTINFVSNNTNIGNNKLMKNKILHSKSLNSQKSVFQKIFVKLTGGFINPYIWILYMCFVIFGFSLIYLHADFMISGISQKLPWDTAIYYSAVTFTTGAYGDIFPIGASRLLSAIEGLLGITVNGAFMVSLVRKYID